MGEALWQEICLKDSPHSCPPSHHGCANHGTGCRISFLERLERHPTYHWKVLRFFSGNLHSQLFLTTFCNLKLPSKSESSKIQQNHNISYRCIMCSPTHIYVDLVLTNMKILRKFKVWPFKSRLRRPYAISRSKHISWWNVDILSNKGIKYA